MPAKSGINFLGKGPLSHTAIKVSAPGLDCLGQVVALVLRTSCVILDKESLASLRLSFCFHKMGLMIL